MTIAHGGAPMNIADGIRGFAAATPGVVAVIDGARSLTYAALDQRASRVANAMLSAGVRPGDHVGVLLGNRLEYPEVACGLAKAGMPMVPVNPRLTASEIAYILEHAEVRALILDDAFSEGVHPAAQHIATVLSIDGTALGWEYERAIAEAGSEDPLIRVDEAEPFCIAYTSGTTGKPKGVMISHRSRCLTFLGTAIEWGLAPGRRTIAVAPLYHGAGFAFGYGALHVGATVSMLRAFDPDAFLAMVERDRAHTVFLVPTHAQMIRALGEDAIAKRDATSLDTLYFNAAPMPQELKLWVMDMFPRVGLHELYGSTEAGIISNLRPEDQRRKERCVGPPWLMTEVRITDPDGNVLARGDTGELYSRSPYLMNGYLKDPAATAACTTDDGFLTCGDVVHIDDDGYLYVVDRVKDMIISGGVNIYPREVEEVVLAHPGVVDCAVVGAPSEQWGEEVVAFVVGDARAAALEAHCRSSLAGFKVPKRFETIENLPRNAAGKVLKRELRARLTTT